MLVCWFVGLLLGWLVGRLLGGWFGLVQRLKGWYGPNSKGWCVNVYMMGLLVVGVRCRFCGWLDGMGWVKDGRGVACWSWRGVGDMVMFA